MNIKNKLLNNGRLVSSLVFEVMEGVQYTNKNIVNSIVKRINSENWVSVTLISLDDLQYEEILDAINVTRPDLYKKIENIVTQELNNNKDTPFNNMKFYDSVSSVMDEFVIYKSIDQVYYRKGGNIDLIFLGLLIAEKVSGLDLSHQYDPVYEVGNNIEKFVHRQEWSIRNV